MYGIAGPFERPGNNFNMRRDASKQPDVMTGAGAPLESLAHGLSEAESPHACGRAEYFEQRRYLVAELTKCHEETAVLGPLIQELNSVSQLERTFSFRDALAFSASSQGDPGDLAVQALKGKIALALQNLQRQAGTICRSPEELDAFMSRLERQFQEIQKTLIHQERRQCADKLDGLCDRLDVVICTLACFPSRARQHEACLSVMSKTLRAYAKESLGESSIRIGGQEGTERADMPEGASMSISEFLNLLDNLTVETLHVFLDQAAA